MPADTQATAEGDLGRTPFAHLLVYAIDRRLTGALFLTEPTGIEHVVRMARGAPVKVKPGDAYMRLGELLVEAKAITPQTLTDALATKGLLGDVLLLAGCVDRDTLEGLAEEQFVRRIVRFFSLPPATTYRYFDGHYELLDYGGDPANVDPLHLVWAGLKVHGDASTMMEGTLSLLGDTPLALHPQATIPRFGFGENETLLIEHLQAHPSTMADLEDFELLPAPELKRLVYTLIITRQLELGRGTHPCGAEEGPRRTSTATLAKVQTRSIVHRVGAAAPDAPGDGGERIPSSRRKKEPDADASTIPRPNDAAETIRDRETPVGDIEPEPPTRPIASSVPVITPPMAPAIVAARGDHRRPFDIAEGVTVDAHPVVASEPTPRIESLSAPDLFDLANARFQDKNLRGALEACSLACNAAPTQPDYAALSVWIRSQLPSADLKALSVELDELCSAVETHAQSRYYRGMLRRRLGDDAGALRDFRRVLEIGPSHAGAAHEIEVLEARAQKTEKAGLLSRIFRR